LACAPPATPPPLPRVAPTPPLSEEEIKPLEHPNIAITDLDETPSPDGKTVTVSGSLINRGHGATREAYVHVEALNHDGAVASTSAAAPWKASLRVSGEGWNTVERLGSNSQSASSICAAGMSIRTPTATSTSMPSSPSIGPENGRS
jgi:hypothetical protein